MDTSIQVDLLLESNTDFSECYIYMDDKKEVVNLKGYEPCMMIREAIHQEYYELMLNTEYGLSTCDANGAVNIFIKKEQIDNLEWRSGHYQIILRNAYGKRLNFMRGTLTIK